LAPGSGGDDFLRNSHGIKGEDMASKPYFGEGMASKPYLSDKTNPLKNWGKFNKKVIPQGILSIDVH
jgi:hypothetical protein